MKHAGNHKGNPWHDARGRFTHGPSGGKYWQQTEERKTEEQGVEQNPISPKEQKRYQESVVFSADLEAESIAEDIREMGDYPDTDTIVGEMRGFYKDMYGKMDDKVQSMNLSELQDFMTNPQNRFSDISEDCAWSNLHRGSDYDVPYITENLAIRYTEDSPVLENRYQALVNGASRAELFAAAMGEEREGDYFLYGDMPALSEVKRRGLHNEYLKVAGN